MQTELFSIEKQIPDWLHEYFHTANAGTYKGKNLFYSLIKGRVLDKHAQKAGFDLQIIEHKCWSCSGTGVYKHYYYEFGQRYLSSSKPCYNCKDGIYRTVKIVLQRYILNGVVYHVPRPDILTESIIPVSIVTGIIEHDKTDPDKAFKAFLIVFWKYAPDDFRNYVTGIIKDASAKKITWLVDLVTSMFQKTNTADELPF